VELEIKGLLDGGGLEDGREDLEESDCLSEGPKGEVGSILSNKVELALLVSIKFANNEPSEDGSSLIDKSLKRLYSVSN